MSLNVKNKKKERLFGGKTFVCQKYDKQITVIQYEEWIRYELAIETNFIIRLSRQMNLAEAFKL